VAGILLDAGCVDARVDEPFRLPSGWASPVYMDCRRLISFPEMRRVVVDRALDLLRAENALTGVVSIAGGEASGIALAAWLADRLDLPLQYVRKKPIGLKHIEGVLRPGSHVLLVDDLMAAGQSKRTFIRALADGGATVSDMIIVFDYATFSSDNMLASRGVRVHALATWVDILAVAKERDTLGKRARDELEAFIDSPGRWSETHGGISESPFLLDSP